MEGAGMNITVMSYCGRLDFGVIACPQSVPEPERVAEKFGASVRGLHALAKNQAA